MQLRSGRRLQRKENKKVTALTTTDRVIHDWSFTRECFVEYARLGFFLSTKGSSSDAYRLQGRPSWMAVAEKELFRSSAIDSYVLQNGTVLHTNEPPSPSASVVAVTTTSGSRYVLGTPRVRTSTS